MNRPGTLQDWGNGRFSNVDMLEHRLQLYQERRAISITFAGLDT